MTDAEPGGERTARRSPRRSPRFAAASVLRKHPLQRGYRSAVRHDDTQDMHAGKRAN